MNLLASLLFPPTCVGCGNLLPFTGWNAEKTNAMCPTCQGLWSSAKEEPCGICGRAVCECECLTSEMKCDGFRKLVYYCHGRREPMQNQLIYRIKDHPISRAVDFIAGEWAPILQQVLQKEGIAPENAVIVWVPRSRRSAARVGHDQAKLLAKALGKTTGIPAKHWILRRRFENLQQKNLSLTERKKNAKRAYLSALDSDLKGKAAILVDDIVTTGATAGSCATILKKQGAKQVFVFSIAADDSQRDPIARQPNMKNAYTWDYFRKKH